MEIDVWVATLTFVNTFLVVASQFNFIAVIGFA